MEKKALIFVVGENLVLRYQAMKKEGLRSQLNLCHREDCFVWQSELTQWSLMNVIRVSYYTSVTGDDNTLATIEKEIAQIMYVCSTGAKAASAQLVPRVFKKEERSRKSRHVDIHITIDIMRAALSTQVDVIWLISGDGDYLPLISEVTRTGKQMYVAALSSGLHQKLSRSVDAFIDLDPFFFLIEKRT